MSDFKVGMRVVYQAGTPEEDHGVITVKNTDDDWASTGTSWWVRWDSDGAELHLQENIMIPELIMNMEDEPIKVREPIEYAIKMSATDFAKADLANWIITTEPTLDDIRAVSRFLLSH